MSKEYSIRKLNKLFCHNVEETHQYFYLAKMVDAFTQEQLKEVNLKTLKKMFPHWLEINHELEGMIKEGLVQRSNGRYGLSIHSFSMNEVEQLKKEAKIKSQELSSLKEKPWLLVLAALSITMDFSQTIALPKGELPLLQASKYQVGQYLYVEAGAEEDLGLADYFTTSRKNLKHKNAEAFIGDVNPQFFLEMVGNVLFTIRKEGTLKGLQTNIFVKALNYYDYLELNETKATLTTPLIKVTETDFYQELKEVEQTIRYKIKLKDKEIWEQELFTSLVLTELIGELGYIQDVILLTKN